MKITDFCKLSLFSRKSTPNSEPWSPSPCFSGFPCFLPFAILVAFRAGDPQNPWKERKNDPGEQGKSQKVKGKEIQNSKERGIREKHAFRANRLANRPFSWFGLPERLLHTWCTLQDNSSEINSEYSQISRRTASECYGPSLHLFLRIHRTLSTVPLGVQSPASFSFIKICFFLGF